MNNNNTIFNGKSMATAFESLPIRMPTNNMTIAMEYTGAPLGSVEIHVSNDTGEDLNSVGHFQKYYNSDRPVNGVTQDAFELYDFNWKWAKVVFTPTAGSAGTMFAQTYSCVQK